MKNVFQRQKYSFLLFTGIFLAILLVLLVMLTAWSQQRTRRILQDDYKQRIKASAQQAAGNLKIEVASLDNKLDFIGQIESIQSLDGDVCNPKLESIFQEAGSSLGNIGRIGPDGKFYCSVNKALIGVEGRTLGKYVEDIFSDPEHRTVMSRAIKPAGSPSYLVAVHVPVRNSENQFLGTLGGGISMQRLRDDVLSKGKPSESGFLTLIDDDGIVLSHPNQDFVGKSLLEGDLLSYYENDEAIAQALRTAIDGKSSDVSYRAEGEDRYAVYEPIEIFPGRTWVVGAVLPAKDVASLSDKLRQRNGYITAGIFFALLFLLIAAGLTYYLNKRVFRPLENIAASARAIRDGDINQKLPKKGSFEILSLADALNTMVEKMHGYSTELEHDVALKTASLSNEKAKVEAILSSIGDAVFAIDTNRKIVVFNPTCEAISGFSTNEAIGKRYDEVLHFVDESTNKENTGFIETALSGSATSLSEPTVLIHKDGRQIPVADSAAPIVDSTGKITGVIVVFRDITKQREIDKAKDEFLSLVSHQLRTPATAVKQSLGVIVENYVDDPEEKKKFIQNAYDSNDEQLHIIDDILSVAKIDSGKLALNKSRVDLGELITKAAAELDVSIKERNQTLELELPDHTITAPVDALKITMSVQNLLSNANKYTPEDGKIKVSLEENDSKVLISVEDNGIGIDKADQAKLFTRFGRIQTDYTIKVQGSGLGLYLVKQFIEMHDGKISLESKPGQGTRFIIELPKES